MNSTVRFILGLTILLILVSLHRLGTISTDLNPIARLWYIESFVKQSTQCICIDPAALYKLRDRLARGQITIHQSARVTEPFLTLNAPTIMSTDTFVPSHEVKLTDVAEGTVLFRTHDAQIVRVAHGIVIESHTPIHQMKSIHGFADRYKLYDMIPHDFTEWFIRSRLTIYTL